MPKPPAAPPSSDIIGADRDQLKAFPKDKAPLPDQQKKLAEVHEGDVARPVADPDIQQEGNPR